MQMAVDNNNFDYWSESKKADLFLEALNRFHFSMEARFLPHVIIEDVNLFANLPEEHLINCSHWLKRKIDKFKRAKDSDDCREVWIGIFKKKSRNQL